MEVHRVVPSRGGRSSSLGSVGRVIAVACVLTSLASTAAAQLLFPANQIRFDSEIDWSTHAALLQGQADRAGSLWTDKVPPKVAIIGAGAAGSSAAYFLSHFRRLEELGLASDVTIFEQNDYIGGRSTVVYPWNDDPYAVPNSSASSSLQNERDELTPVELGASIFVNANRNLMKAARVFNLTLETYEGEDGGMGVWDGEQFVWKEAGGWGWGYWDIARMFWRYGRAPLRVKNLTEKMVKAFVGLYSRDFASYGPFASLAVFAAATNISQAASIAATTWYAENGISPLFTSELIAAATQVNYGTHVSQIHGLGAGVSMAATGASSVKGGNRQIFERFVDASGASLRLGRGARVESIVKLDAPDGKRPKWVIHSAGGGGTFDAVIIAAPFHQMGTKLLNTPACALIPPQPYVPLHVTFVITNASFPSSAYFSSSAKVPTAVFATFDTDSTAKPDFNSLNYLKPLPLSATEKFGTDEYHVVKMFSADPLGSDLIDSIFGPSTVAKVWSKKWLAYPKLRPIKSEDDLAAVRPDEGLYYVNGFERLVSTMETETVSAFNVVSLLLQDFYGYKTPSSWAEWDDKDVMKKW